MAKVTGPLLSMGARGSIGKSMVIASWKGVKYARQHVIPANPRTTAQQANRTRFALLREMWKLAPAIVQAPWIAFTEGRPLMPVNKYVGENNRLLNGSLTMLPMLQSPGARGGLPPVSITAVPGAADGQISVTVDVPDQLPVGWTVTATHAAAIVDQDPTGIFSGPFVAGTDAGGDAAIILAGFDPGAACIAFGWVEYEKPDGKAAYSVSLSAEVEAADVP